MGKVLFVSSDEYAARFVKLLIRKLNDWEVALSNCAIGAISAAKKGDTDVIVINSLELIKGEMQKIELELKRITEFHHNALMALAHIKKINPDQRVIFMSDEPEMIRNFCKTFGVEAILEIPSMNLVKKLAELIFNPQIN